MLTVLLSLVAAIWIAGLVILVVGARRAPRGYEDERGFHAVSDAEQATAPYHHGTSVAQPR
jgi:hypothetical protein